jgi:hypothetical protein
MIHQNYIVSGGGANKRLQRIGKAAGENQETRFQIFG